MGQRTTNFDRQMIAIRQDPIVGRGSGSVIDTQYTGDRLRSQILTSEASATALGAVAEARRLQRQIDPLHEVRRLIQDVEDYPLSLRIAAHLQDQGWTEIRFNEAVVAGHFDDVPYPVCVNVQNYLRDLERNQITPQKLPRLRLLAFQL